MHITVKDLLKLAEFQEVEVIAGEAGLNRKVQNVNFMEVPDIYSYIDKNSLLFTTLYPIADNDDAIESLIPKLVESGLAGVAVKPGRYIDKIPEVMIEQANKCKFPLLKLHDDSNLSTLTIQVLSILLGMKTSKLEFRDTMHRRLLDLLLEGADLNEFLRSVGEIIDAPVLVFDNEFTYMDSTMGETGKNIQVITKNKRSANYMSSTNDISLKIGAHLYAHDDLVIQPIFAGRASLGYVVVIMEKEKSKIDNLIVTVEQASILLAVLFQTEQTMLQKERNYLDNFIREIFSGRYTSQTEVIEKAKVFKWKLNFPVTILNIKTNIKDSSKKLAVYNHLLDSGLVEGIISEEMDIPRESCKVFYYNDAVVCFVSIAFERRLQERLTTVGKKIIANFARFSNLAITVSDTVYNISHVKVAYENALLAHNIYANNLAKESFIKFYDELGLYKLFHSVAEQPLLQEYVHDLLGEIIELDEQKDAKLLETIHYFIKNNGNLQKTADEMFIHYNTLRYRINKLKKLGVDVEDGYKITELSVAYQMYQYLQLIQSNK